MAFDGGSLFLAVERSHATAGEMGIFKHLDNLLTRAVLVPTGGRIGLLRALNHLDIVQGCMFLWWWCRLHDERVSLCSSVVCVSPSGGRD